MKNRRHPTGDNVSPLPPDDLNGLREWLEERSLDALLAETLAGSDPPDLTEPILERLARPAEPLPETALDPPSSDPPIPAPSRNADPVPPPVVYPGLDYPGLDHADPTLPTPHPARKLAVVAVIAAAVAATLLAITSFGDPESNDRSPRLADGQVEPDTQPAPMSDLAANDHGASTETIGPLPDAGGPRNAPRILVPPAEPGDPAVASPHAAEIATADDRTGASSAPPIRMVSRRFETEFRNYWDAVGVTPSDDRAADSIADLVSDRLGIPLSENDLGDVGRIRAVIAREGNAETVASRWLDRVTEGGLARLKDPAKAAIVQEIASAFRGTRRADVVFERWLSGESEHASAWYQAVARGGSNAMVRRLGALTMDVDLRCTRCHDSHVERDGLQDSYWGFAAMFRRDLDRRDDGAYVVRDDDTEPVDVFYDLPDGRRRLAEPAIPSRWLELDRADIDDRAATGDDSPVTLRTWASALRGSEPLARGIVNSLWELVHGRPLHASVIDPLTAPRDATLQRLEGELAGDLIASGFDLSRTLALIVSSPVTARSILDESTEDSLFAASESTRRAVAAFAAATPHRSPLNMTRKVDIALRSVGGKIGTLGEDEKLLAQVGAQGEQDRDKQGSRAEFQIPTDFPVRADAPPVNWLDDLDHWDEKLDHLAYLSGRDRLPDNVRSAAEGMRDAELDEALILHRVWWLLQR